MKRFRDEAKKQSPSVYLTIISIIQSFALGFLLSTAREVITNAPTHLAPFSSTAAITWLQVIAAFQAIVLCWHVNISNAVVMQRLIGLSDSYIPFVFAIPQFVMVASIQPRNLCLWFFGLAAYSFVALWAYAMMYFKDRREPENAEAFGELRWHPRFNLVYAAVATPLFAIIGRWHLRHPFSDTATIWWLALCNLVFVVFTYFHCHFWNNLTSSEPPLPKAPERVEAVYAEHI